MMFLKPLEKEQVLVTHQTTATYLTGTTTAG